MVDREGFFLERYDFGLCFLIELEESLVSSRQPGDDVFHAVEDAFSAFFDLALNGGDVRGFFEIGDEEFARFLLEFFALVHFGVERRGVA